MRKIDRPTPKTYGKRYTEPIIIVEDKVSIQDFLAMIDDKTSYNKLTRANMISVINCFSLKEKGEYIDKVGLEDLLWMFKRACANLAKQQLDHDLRRVVRDELRNTTNDRQTITRQWEESNQLKEECSKRRPVLERLSQWCKSKILWGKVN